MLVSHLDEYAKKYQHVKFEREEGILQITLHTDNHDLVWGVFLRTRSLDTASQILVAIRKVCVQGGREQLVDGANPRRHRPT